MRKLLLIFMLLMSLTSAKAQEDLTTVVRDTIKNHISSRPHRQRMLFSLQGGLAYSLTDYSNFENQTKDMSNGATETDKYLDQLKNGYNVNASLHYLLTSTFGLGIDYNFFSYSAIGKFVSPGSGTETVQFHTSYDLDERIYANYFGLSVIFQQFPDKGKKIKISETISPGYVFFRDETRTEEYRVYYEVTGVYNGEQIYDRANSMLLSNAFAAKGGLSIEYIITPHISAGLAGSYTWAKLKKAYLRALHNNHSGELENPIDISHIDYGFTVRYSF